MVRLAWQYDPSPPGFTGACTSSDVDAVFKVRHNECEVQMPGAYPMEMCITQPVVGVFGGAARPTSSASKATPGIGSGSTPTKMETEGEDVEKENEPAAASNDAASGQQQAPDESKNESRRNTAIVIAHGIHAADYKAKFLTEVASLLAREGYTVVRFASKLVEKKRVAAYQAAVEAAASSPYCRIVTRWVFGGVSLGARIAAAAVHQLHTGAWVPQLPIDVAGAALVAYPFHEQNEAASVISVLAGGTASVTGERSATRGRQANDSGHEALVKLTVPIMFCVGTNDERCDAEVLRLAASKLSSPKARYVMLPGCNNSLKRKGGKHVDAVALKTVAGSILDWIRVLETGEETPSSGVLLSSLPDAAAWEALAE